jgi:hypothetical protein
LTKFQKYGIIYTPKEREVNKMNVYDKREIEKVTVSFNTLKVGEVYEDIEGNICIKTSNECPFDSTCGQCLAMISGEWGEGEESLDAPVVPLKADLILRGYK